jgi:hypothetical protein
LHFPGRRRFSLQIAVKISFSGPFREAVFHQTLHRCNGDSCDGYFYYDGSVQTLVWKWSVWLEDDGLVTEKQVAEMLNAGCHMFSMFMVNKDKPDLHTMDPKGRA